MLQRLFRRVEATEHQHAPAGAGGSQRLGDRFGNARAETRDRQILRQARSQRIHGKPARAPA